MHLLAADIALHLESVFVVVEAEILGKNPHFNEFLFGD